MKYILLSILKSPIKSNYFINNQNKTNKNKSKSISKSTHRPVKVSYRFLLSGRLNGAKMARNYMKYNGRTKTQTYNNNSDNIQKNIYTK
jgi:ribosomal protein S3